MNKGIINSGVELFAQWQGLNSVGYGNCHIAISIHYACRLIKWEQKFVWYTTLVWKYLLTPRIAHRFVSGTLIYEILECYSYGLHLHLSDRSNGCHASSSEAFALAVLQDIQWNLLRTAIHIGQLLCSPSPYDESDRLRKVSFTIRLGWQDTDLVARCGQPHIYYMYSCFVAIIKIYHFQDQGLNILSSRLLQFHLIINLSC